MSPTKNRLHLLISAVRRYFAPRGSRAPLCESRSRATAGGDSVAQAVDQPDGTDPYLAKHGPIQITTLHGVPMVTQDGIPVQITAKLAWSSTLSNAEGQPQGADTLASARSPGRQDEVSAEALAREALRTTVLGCGLAGLLCERHVAEEQVRLDVARRGEASGLIVHLVRIRGVDIPASVQAAGDARQLLAMHTYVERQRLADRCTRANPGMTVIGGLTW